MHFKDRGTPVALTHLLGRLRVAGQVNMVPLHLAQPHMLDGSHGPLAGAVIELEHRRGVRWLEFVNGW